MEWEPVAVCADPKLWDNELGKIQHGKLSYLGVNQKINKPICKIPHRYGGLEIWNTNIDCLGKKV